MEERFSIRRFSNSDVRGIVQLLNVVCKPVRPFNEDWWAWKYQKNPVGFFGEQGDVWIAEDQGKIVGHYAVIPIKVKIGKETMAVGQSVDTAVDPEYRGMGIFSALAKKVYGDSAGRYSLLYGYPSEMAFKGFIGLGWKDYPINEIAKFINFSRPLTSFLSSNSYLWAAKTFLKTWQTVEQVSSIRNIFRKFNGKDVVMCRIETFKDEVNVIWESNKDEKSVILERTVPYLNWRFSKSFGDYLIWIGRSANDERLLGYSVFRKTRLGRIDNVLEIVDLFTLPGEEKLVLAVIGLALGEKDIDLIYLRLPVWHRYARIFSNLGFIRIRSVLNRLGSYEPKLLLYDFGGKHPILPTQRWLYSLADTDYA